MFKLRRPVSDRTWIANRCTYIQNCTRRSDVWDRAILYTIYTVLPSGHATVTRLTWLCAGKEWLNTDDSPFPASRVRNFFRKAYGR